MAVTLSPALLAPAAALIVWTLLMLLWLGFARFSAFKGANIDIGKVPAGGRGQDLEGVLPPHVNWPSHNYTHLMEQPTLFYATVIMLALMGQGTSANVGLAWTYVILRIAHSLWQAKINTIPVRFTLFILSSAALLGLAVNALTTALSA